MRTPLAFIVLTACLALCAGPNALAYPWPVKPFHKQHPIRANFGDPRTRFWNTLLTDGLQGPGLFAFHNGIDIAAPDGTPVYPVVSGTAKLLSADAVAVRTDDNRTFQYFHIAPTIRDGEQVVAGRTVLGDVIAGVHHVHLSEIRGFHIWNPLARGGISPYNDHTVPEVDSITARPVTSLLPLDSEHLCGTVSLVAAAHDTPPIRVPGTFAGFPVSPAFVSWSLGRITGGIYVPDIPVADFRTTLPGGRDFWDVYARGSFQNTPRFSNRQYTMPGRFLYNLAAQFDTRAYPNGVFEATVYVKDMRGNESESAQRFTIANRAGTDTGCPAQAPRSTP